MNDDPNLVRLRAVVALFQLPVTTVAKHSGTSRSYISKVLSGRITPSARVLRNLESRLGELVNDRPGHLFEVPAVDAGVAEEVLGEMGRAN